MPNDTSDPTAAITVRQIVATLMVVYGLVSLYVYDWHSGAVATIVAAATSVAHRG